MQNLKDKDRDQLQPALAVSLRPAEKQNNKKDEKQKEEKRGCPTAFNIMKPPPAATANQPKEAPHLNPPERVCHWLDSKHASRRGGS
jgi:hypothetical protein